MAKFVGIDLGTTYSAISVLDDLGKPEIVPVDQDRIMPSVVYFDEDDATNVLIGTIAKNKLSDEEEAERIVQDVKRHMGINKQYNIDGNNYTPVQVSSFILKKLVQAASEVKGKITEAVITVPANFSEKERKATMDAGKLAGLDVKHIINEPTAAAIYYASQNPVAGKVLIYDLGGGTFDVTIAKVSGNNIEIIASEGDRHLGGKDFDLKLVELFNKKYMDEFGVSLVDDENRQFYIEKAEEIKLNLSKKDRQKIKLKGNAGRTQVDISRSDFEEAISTFIAKTELLIDSVMDEAELTPSEINQILIVGGSTRIPFIQKSLTRIFNKEPLKVMNPDEAVSLGAAIYAGLNADIGDLNAAQATAISSLKLTEVCNHFYGTIIVTQDPASGKVEESNFIILKKNTPLPCSDTHPFTTISDGQTSINCAVTQSKAEETNPEFVQIIWEGNMEGLPEGRPAGQPVEVTFSYDKNQRMHCHFKDVNSGKKLDVDLHPAQAEELGKQQIIVENFLIE